MFTLIFRINPPSHSCEGRNLLAEGANCRRRRTNVQLPAAMRRRRFLPSQEWDGLFFFDFAGMNKWKME
ncbi:MAG: hypothetical protein ACR2QC_08830 [Gammaproteobacteria bacterium]